MLERRRAGTYRHHLQVQKYGQVPADDGYEDLWATFSDAWASVLPIQIGTDVPTANTVQNAVTHTVRLDFRAVPLLKPKHRFLMRSDVGGPDRKLYIRDVRNEDERNATWVCQCEERV